MDETTLMLEHALALLSEAKQKVQPYGAAWYAISRARTEIHNAIRGWEEEND